MRLSFVYATDFSSYGQLLRRCWQSNAVTKRQKSFLHVAFPSLLPPNFPNFMSLKFCWLNEIIIILIFLLPWMEHLQLFVSKLVIDARDGEPESHHCHRRQKILFETKRDHNSSNRSLRHVLDQFGKLPTYPSPQSTLTLASYLGQNVGLGEG